MEIREVKIEEYWPLIVKGTAEFGQIAAALNPEFNKLAECIYRVLNESFIQDASEYGVSRWESILGINPASGATLDDRKAAILTYMTIKLPYTWRVLKQMLVPILGGEDKFVMEYFNDEYKLVLHTDRLNDAMLATVSDLLERVLPQNIEVERYNHNIEISWRDINKYAECVTVDDMLAVNPDFKNDVTSDGEWVYPFLSLRTASNSSNWWGGTNRIKKATLNVPVITYMHELFWACSSIKELYLYAPACTKIETIVAATNVSKVTLYTPSLTHSACTFYGCHSLEEFTSDWSSLVTDDRSFRNAKKLRVFASDLSNLKTSNEMFHNCILNKESALRILNSIPSYTSGTHKLLLGIHVDHKTDSEVLEAIANAESKGWTMTVQWNGTPTSGISTTDLEEIWCKVTESEHGEYVNENGNRCTLEWGHYVTDTTEYKLFYSLVEAEQYFKLTKVNENE